MWLSYIGQNKMWYNSLDFYIHLYYLLLDEIIRDYK